MAMCSARKKKKRF